MANRAERRRQTKREQAKTKVYHLTQEQIDGLLEAAKNEAVEIALPKAFQMFMCIPATVLHDKFGFGQVRMDRFMHYVMMWYESLQNGETTMGEIRKMAEESCGYQIIVDSIVDKK